MSITNEIWLTVDGHRTCLDTDESTLLLPTFQANDRTSPSTLENDYSPEFSVPATAKNHRLLRHAAASQNVAGTAYTRVPCVLTSGGIETLPLALLYIKGYEGGRYNLQITGGNRRLVDALKNPDGSDKKLSDLDLSRFDHYWTPTEILPRLSYDYRKQNGFGYEIYERGKPLDLKYIDPYTLYPSCSANLVWQQLVTDAGFTADTLLGEPFWAALTIPSANPFTFSQDYRDARALKSGFQHNQAWFRGDEFQELAPFNYVGRKPYAAGKLVDTSGGVNRYVVPTLGYYDLNVSLAVYFGCNERLFGQVSMKVLLQLNGAPLLNEDGTEVKGEERFKGYKSLTLTAAKKRVLLKPGDVIDVRVQGDKWPDGIFDPDDPEWSIGTRVVRFPGSTYPLDFSGVEPACSFSVDLLPEFPQGGLVKLQDWLPEMKQIDFVKSVMLLLGLTVMTDLYEPHLKLAPGSRLLENISKAKDWTRKRDAYAQPGRLPERALEFRFGNYAKLNKLLYEPDDNVTAGYGDGLITVKDEVLPDSYELAKLPFAATEASPVLPTLLRILNFDTEDATANPVVYSTVDAKPRLTLRSDSPELAGQLIMVPAVFDNNGNLTKPEVLADFTTTANYFVSPTLSLDLNETVLTTYWADLRAMLSESRYLTERYRLTAQDIVELDFSIPVYDKGLNDFFAVSKIAEFDSRRPVEVTLIRLNPTHLPPPTLPDGTVGEWFAGEFSQTPKEFY